MTSFDASHSIVRRTGVPNDWSERALAEIVRIVGGGTPDRSEGAYWRDGGIPWITPTDLTANNRKYITQGIEHISEAGLQNSNATLVPQGSIVFSTRGTVGNMAITGIPLTCNQSCEVLVPKTEEANSDFLYYLLAFGMSAFHRLSAGTTFSAITRRDIGRVRFAFPPLHEQAAIARILDAVDTTIERTREVVGQAWKLRKSLITDLLSLGVDTNGHVRDSMQASKQFARTPLGLLPTEWRLSTVGAEFELQNGFTLNEGRRPRYRKRRYLRVANVQRDALFLDDIQELEAGDTELAPRVLEVNDLLVVEGHADRMQIGRCAKVTEEVQGVTFQNHLFRLRACGEVLPYFGCLWLNSTHAQRYWNARCATSSGLNTINQRMLKRLIVPVPPKHEQQIIIDIVSAQRKYLETLVAKQQNLESLKKSLMHDLLTGKVRVDLSHSGFQVPASFFEPLPDDLLDAFEGRQ